MSGIRLLTNSAYQGATIAAGTLAVTSGAALAAYLNDRDAGPQWVAADGAAQTITVDTQNAGTLPLVTTLALLHHNLTGSPVSLSGSTDGASYVTVKDPIVVTGDPFMVTIPATSYRYWRLFIAPRGTPARLGELMLGVVHDVLDNPNLPTGKPAIVGNVARDRSPAGYPWNTRKGVPRRRYPYRWNAMPDADYATMLHAFDECDEGTWPLVLTDQLGAVLWATWEDPVFGPPDVLGKQLQQVAATFEEVPL